VQVKLREMKPGQLSQELKDALGMPEGAPPPWLINMQRYGPPPSYPQLKIPGLNAPIPEGASFGYHAGGWGKPPVDEVSCMESFMWNCIRLVVLLLFVHCVHTNEILHNIRFCGCSQFLGLCSLKERSCTSSCL
jgi:hypothetical protein